MKQLLMVFALWAAMGARAQNVGIGTSSPNANAKLDITATDKGLLIPRMDSVHRKSIPYTAGLLVYDSTYNSFWYNTGSGWKNISTFSTGWSLTGNSNIDSTNDNTFIGTTDDRPLVFKLNNYFSGKIDIGACSFGLESYSAPNNLSPHTVAIGTGSLGHNMADNNSTAGFYNTAVGDAVMVSNTYGTRNTGLGAGAMERNTTGSFNAAIGTYALLLNTTGSHNTALGDSSMLNGITGSFNTALGAGSLLGGGASYNTAVGYRTDVAVNTTNATAIGANANADASNKIRLGDANVTVVESNGVFNTVSDGRFKYNIEENVKGLDFIMQLRPVTYQFDTKKQEDFTKGRLTEEQLNSTVVPASFNESNGIKRTGFIAQEVAAAAKKLAYDFDGVKIPAADNQYYSLSYASFVVPLVKAMQEQQQTINTLKKQNELLQQQNEMILKRLETLENKK